MVTNGSLFLSKYDMEQLQACFSAFQKQFDVFESTKANILFRQLSTVEEQLQYGCNIWNVLYFACDLTVTVICHAKETSDFMRIIWLRCI